MKRSQPEPLNQSSSSKRSTSEEQPPDESSTEREEDDPVEDGEIDDSDSDLPAVIWVDLHSTLTMWNGGVILVLLIIIFYFTDSKTKEE